MLSLAFALLARYWDELHREIGSEQRVKQFIVVCKYLFQYARLPGFKAYEKMESAMLIALQSDFYVKLSLFYLMNL